MESVGSRVPAKYECVVAVTEQQDESGSSVRKGRPNNHGNYRQLCGCPTRRSLKKEENEEIDCGLLKSFLMP